MSEFTRGLNESQKKAVTHNEGPLLVLAGAGSGKTRVLTMRIARLVHQKKCRPEEILAVTFTNKAAKEMKERVAQITSPRIADAMTLSTFHSLGVKILREVGEKVGLQRSFTIIGDYERNATLRSIMRAAGVRGLKTEDPDRFAERISLAKNASLDPDQFYEQNPEERKVHRVYSSYRQILLKRHTVDFDDLLLLPLQIFQKHPDVLEMYRKRYRYLSIDEFQDTNAVQMKLAALMAAPLNNIMAVGDDDQGIYSWRGANIENILTFSSSFKNCTTVVLDKNYRSTPQILGAALAVIAHNRVRKIKDIDAVDGDGDPIVHYKGDDEEDEAVWIATKIAENNEHTSLGYGDHAILVRTNAIMRRYEEELRRQRIPYRVSGAMSFFERKEIKDALAYVRFFANPHDELSLARVLKVPNKGITPTALEALDDFAALRKTSLWDAFVHHGDAHGISAEQQGKIAAFVEFHRKHDHEFGQGQLAATLRAVLKESGYTELLARAFKDEADHERRTDNIEEIIHGLELFEQKYRKRKPTLAMYLQELALVANEDNDDDDGSEKRRGVVLMTLHKSKGLEFPAVFLASLDSEVMPSPRAVEEGNTEEERRLFYVGMTRARKRLFLTYPGTKVFRGKSRKVTPCPFLREIPEEFLDGKIGEKQDQEKQQFIDDFFKEMKTKFTAPGPE